ncbi:recQ [Mytilus coruscus]|uniref:DNA 3'-5' helicase n=1 Tax=Mytilus coruscus TaxID=42192 RepID=A0A6J8ABS2_MYTCO|nr:recQ [Mytilus coruscus]
MDADQSLQIIQDRYDFIFKEKQLDSVKSILENKDCFIVLPTGYGKSRIYFHLPELFEMTTTKKSSILVISPLQALMLDQMKKLQDMGITATVVGECQKDKGVADRISAAGAEFRQEYSMLDELRSIFPEKTPFVALTVTATKEMKFEIMKKLNMEEDRTDTIWMLPERPNLTCIVKKTTKQMTDLQWILNDIKVNEEKAKKTIVYCRNISSCAALYEYFFYELSESADDVHSRRIAMFHRSTAEANKVHVMSEFPKLDSKVCIVFATIAFGMGVDIADVEQIIHWGAPRGLEQFTQESGRAEIKCCKEILSDYFSLDNKPHRSITKTCKCCSFCKANCECGCCDRLDFIDNIASTQQQYKLQHEDADLHRHISDNKSILLKENLLDFHSILEDEDAPGCTYFNDSAINEIVRNAPYLYCEEDIILLGVGDIELAREILLLIKEIV